MEEDNWFSAILITIVIKIAWAYYQTMKDISEEESLREYHTAASFNSLSNGNSEITTPNKNETPKRFNGDALLSRDMNIKRRLNVFTSTPVLSSCTSNDIAENISGITDLDEQMNDIRLNSSIRLQQIGNQGRFQSELNEVESSILRLSLARGVSPKMEMKYKHLFNRSVKGDKRRKNLRL